jgi:hypothetical protein
VKVDEGVGVDLVSKDQLVCPSAVGGLAPDSRFSETWLFRVKRCHVVGFVIM